MFLNIRVGIRVRGLHLVLYYIVSVFAALFVILSVLFCLYIMVFVFVIKHYMNECYVSFFGIVGLIFWRFGHCALFFGHLCIFHFAFQRCADTRDYYL